MKEQSDEPIVAYVNDWFCSTQVRSGRTGRWTFTKMWIYSRSLDHIGCDIALTAIMEWKRQMTKTENYIAISGSTIPRIVSYFRLRIRTWSIIPRWDTVGYTWLETWTTKKKLESARNDRVSFDVYNREAVNVPLRLIVSVILLLWQLNVLCLVSVPSFMILTRSPVFNTRFDKCGDVPLLTNFELKMMCCRLKHGRYAKFWPFRDVVECGGVYKHLRQQHCRNSILSFRMMTLNSSFWCIDSHFRFI